MYPWDTLTTDFNFFYKTEFTFNARKILEEYKEVDKRFKFSTEFPIPPTGWQLLSLRSYLGDPLNVRSLSTYVGTKEYTQSPLRQTDIPDKFLWTEAAKYTPFLKETIENIGCQIYRVRLARIIPYGFIHIHIDSSHWWAGNTVRLFVPLVCTPKSHQKICHEMTRSWAPGDVWYGDYAFPHRAWNMDKNITRVGVIIDFDAKDMREKYPNLLPPEYHDQLEEKIECLKEVREIYNTFRGTIQYA